MESGMKSSQTLWLTLSLFFILCLSSVQADTIRTQSLGEIGGGIFIPTGSDANIARSVLITNRFGFESELHYVPILLEKNVLTTSAHRKASQLALLGGLRATTSRIAPMPKQLIGYASARIGFARITVRSDSTGFAGGWIGRPIDQIQNPQLVTDPFTGLQFPQITRPQITRQKGLVLSPKIGTLLRLTKRSFIDMAFTPLFIFDRGDITTQYYFTISYGLSSQSSF
jgi:hypothetical protein